MKCLTPTEFDDKYPCGELIDRGAYGFIYKTLDNQFIVKNKISVIWALS